MANDSNNIDITEFQKNSRETVAARVGVRPDHVVGIRTLPADAVIEVGPAAPQLSERLRDWAASQG